MPIRQSLPGQIGVGVNLSGEVILDLSRMPDVKAVSFTPTQALEHARTLIEKALEAQRMERATKTC